MEIKYWYCSKCGKELKATLGIPDPKIFGNDATFIKPNLLQQWYIQQCPNGCKAEPISSMSRSTQKRLKSLYEQS